jgi:hypothetical protein
MFTSVGAVWYRNHANGVVVRLRSIMTITVTRFRYVGSVNGIIDSTMQKCSTYHTKNWPEMPTYDVECPEGHEHEIVTSWDDRQTPCPTCGLPTERVWRGKPPGAVADTLPGGGRLIENLGHEPVWVETYTELRRQCRARGLTPFVRHAPGPHGDKSRITTRWI